MANKKLKKIDRITPVDPVTKSKNPQLGFPTTAVTVYPPPLWLPAFIIAKTYPFILEVRTKEEKERVEKFYKAVVKIRKCE